MKKTTTPVFRLASAPAELKPALKAVAAFYPALRGGADAPAVSFKKNADAAAPSAAMPDKNGWCVSYGSKTHALRLLGQLLSGTLGPIENRPFESVGVMIDCSRNAVRTVPYLKTVFARLALLGYNQVMLYCEDTYRLPGEPFFGMHRGAYTAAEVRELDDYAFALGIELVPCIETIGHLEQIFRWAPYRDINDCGGIILAGEEKSYALIEKMIEFWSSNVRSRKMHLGMDEAWGIGTGKYKKLNGERKPFDIMGDHLVKLREMCAKRGLKPYMWSDMWFRDFGNGNFYDNMEIEMPEECRKRIPGDVTLCYWDYYSDSEEKYAKRIAGHLRANGTVQMSSGVWTWGMFWHSMRHTIANATPCIAASRKAGVKELLFTMWGDDGAFCDFESAFSGLAYCAELCYTGSADYDVLRRRYAALCGGASYEAVAALGAWGEYALTSLVWEDPMMFLCQSYLLKHEIWVNHDKVKWEELFNGFKTVSKTLAKAPAPACGCGGSIAFARAVAGVALSKMTLFKALVSARPATPAARRAAVKKALPAARALVRHSRAFEVEMRKVWMAQNKPQGSETIQIRLAGATARAEEALRRYTEFAAGKAADLPELVDVLSAVDLDCSCNGGWARLAHGTVIS